jgi:hypothetical protein
LGRHPAKIRNQVEQALACSGDVASEFRCDAGPGLFVRESVLLQLVGPFERLRAGFALAFPFCKSAKEVTGLRS